jgi:gluconate 5-dehydrogenase
MIRTFDLSNKVILITGGYGFLGKAITESLAYHGAIIYVLGRDGNKFKECFGEYVKDGKIKFCSCDISKATDISAAFKKVEKVEERIDVLINNAFYSKGQSPENMTDEEWSYGLEGSLTSMFKGIREIIPYLKKNNGGKIINVSSMYGMVAPDFEVYRNHPNFLNPPHYGAAKAGVIQLTKYYASYLGRFNINVNAVTPGPFPSNEVKKSQDFVESLSEKTCLGRIGLPEDLGGAFVFLASNASDYVTGQNIVVDGGWTTK